MPVFVHRCVGLPMSAAFQAPARKMAPGGLQRVVLEHFRRQPAKWPQEASRGPFLSTSGASPKVAQTSHFGRVLESFRSPPPSEGFALGRGGGDAGQSQVPYPNLKVCIWCRSPRIPILSARTPIPLLRTLNFRQNFAKILGFFVGAHHGNDLVHLVPCFTGEEALRTNRAHAGTTILLTKDNSRD